MKISPSSTSNTITMKTKDVQSKPQMAKWWTGGSARERAEMLISTAAYLKESQGYKQRQAALYARLYGNKSLFSFIGANMSNMEQATGLPVDRPTFNLVQSCVDTLVSRISQNRPAPIFLTDNGDYKERNIAKKLNNFILGEFYNAKAYEKVAMMLRDALVLGTGVLKIVETPDKKVGLERRLLIEIFTDANESIYGEPRQLYEIKLVDRNVLRENFNKPSIIESAANAFPDNSKEASKTISDLVMVVESWHLRSGPDAKDGRHAIACDSGILVDEEYDKDKFPFVFLHYSDPMLGFWAQGLAEQLMGTQMEINSLLFTIARAIKLVGVPRVFVEDGSKVVKSHFNNDIGSIVTYRGTKPQFEVAPCVPQEMYAQLQRLIDYGYNQCGVSQLQATSQKPAGLNSGEALRSYDDISADRSAALSRRYDNVFIDLAYGMTDSAKDIAERDGAYATVYPGKDGTAEIDFPDCSLLKNPYVIQCFNQSSLPREPAGRLQKVTEMIQAGMISIKEGRRLLDFPDISQMEKLANAAEERIFKQLDNIVEEGEYSPPDSFTDLALATEFVVEYINLYSCSKLEEDKMQQLRDYYSQVLAIKQAAQPPAMPPQGANPPQASPEPQPSSPLVPNATLPGAQ